MEMPDKIWATTYTGELHREYGQNYGEWADEPDKSLDQETEYTRTDLTPSPEVLKQVYNALDYYADCDNLEIDGGDTAREALSLLEPFVKEKT